MHLEQAHQGLLGTAQRYVSHHSEYKWKPRVWAAIAGVVTSETVVGRVGTVVPLSATATATSATSAGTFALTTS